MWQPSDMTYGTKFWLCCGAQCSAGEVGVGGGWVKVRAYCMSNYGRAKGGGGTSFDSGGAELDVVAP